MQCFGEDILKTGNSLYATDEQWGKSFKGGGVGRIQIKDAEKLFSRSSADEKNENKERGKNRC